MPGARWSEPSTEKCSGIAAREAAFRGVEICTTSSPGSYVGQPGAPCMRLCAFFKGCCGRLAGSVGGIGSWTPIAVVCALRAGQASLPSCP